jgi:hypothetical protein
MGMKIQVTSIIMQTTRKTTILSGKCKSLNSNGSKAKPFKELAYMGVSHFKNLYKDPNRINIAEIVKITSLFPSFVEEENELLIKCPWKN